MVKGCNHEDFPVRKTPTGRRCGGCGYALVEAGDAAPPVADSSLSEGVRLIAQERVRQVKAEGWTPEHDDAHAQYELAKAAQAYVYFYYRRHDEGLNFWSVTPPQWPWGRRWWKPDESSSGVGNLVKAGALIAAEIDRLLRAGSSTPLQSPAPIVTDTLSDTKEKP